MPARRHRTFTSGYALTGPAGLKEKKWDFAAFVPTYPYL